MPGLAMHNFRGFHKTSIFFSDVNFFVGENSTGKTSVLSAMEILSDPMFFYTGALSSSYCDLSIYEDAATQNGDNKSFSLGYYRAGYMKNKSGWPDAVAFHFINERGLVKTSKIQYLANGYLVHVAFHKDKVTATVSDIKDLPAKPLDALEDLMWGRSTAISGERVGRFTYLYKKLPMPSPMITAMNVLAIEKIKRNEDDPFARTRVNASLFPDVFWGAPIRAKPEPVNAKISNIYTPEGSHIPSIIRRVYGEQNDPILEERVASDVRKFGKNSHLFDDISVKEYGTDHAAPFEVRVNFNDDEHKLSNVGYGVSQALPMLIEVASARDDQYFVIQQPEVHLHPRAQAAFGDFFFEMAQKREHSFFIETHSDFLIDRFRLQLKRSLRKKKPSAQIIFFKKSDSGGNSLIRIPISSSGMLPDNTPPEYKDFFYKEEFEMLEIR